MDSTVDSTGTRLWLDCGSTVATEARRRRAVAGAGEAGDAGAGVDAGAGAGTGACMVDTTRVDLTVDQGGARLWQQRPDTGTPAPAPVSAPVSVPAPACL